MDDVAPPAMPTLVRVSAVLLVICALVSVPWSVHNLAMLLGHENFGWGIFAIFFFDAPMALLQLVLAVVLTAQGARAEVGRHRGVEPHLIHSCHRRLRRGVWQGQRLLKCARGASHNPGSSATQGAERA